MCCTRLAEIQDAKIAKNSPSGHHSTTLLGYIFATKACIDNRKKNLLNGTVSSTCPHNTVNFGPLAAEICRQVWGTPANFYGFRVLAALLHNTLLGVSQTLQHWTEGATCIVVDFLLIWFFVCLLPLVLVEWKKNLCVNKKKYAVIAHFRLLALRQRAG